MFRNKKPNQQNERKYIGIVLEVHNQKYFAPLSSFKTKHNLISEGLDLIKIKHLAVINLNNMFPVPPSQIVNFNIKTVHDQKSSAFNVLRMMCDFCEILVLFDKLFFNATFPMSRVF